MRAILSVYDKTGLEPFARGLVELGFDLYSTGGTRRALEGAGVPVASISELTSFPEIMDGRVKTLHPGVHAGILARRDVPAHMSQLAEQGLSEIDLVAVNLYPFEATIARPDATFEQAIENIDIGGPAMIRAAAKNHASVVVVVDPGDYDGILQALSRGEVPEATRRALAATAYAHTSAYDAAVTAYLTRLDEAAGWPRQFTLAGARRQEMRYGENPHQGAALYTQGAVPSGVAGAVQLQGKELSYNNIVDADAAWELVHDLPLPSAVIIKHTNPCGAAAAETVADAYQRAYECDTVSAFGGVVALNDECDEETARRITSIMVEIVAAPTVSAGAREVFAAKKNLRVLEIKAVPPAPTVKVVSGGFLLQDPDTDLVERSDLRVVSRRPPTDNELDQLLFAWRVVKHVKSNAIVLARDLAAVGVGAGQMSRVESVQIAVHRAGDRAAGCVMASDAFFPFADGVEAAAAAGITAVIQPGGSVRDEEVLAAADAAGMAMVYTGRRHFRH